MDKLNRLYKLHHLLRSRRLPVALARIQEELGQHFASAYGIFAGTPTATAILRFTPTAAKWVADEQWHPQQKGTVLPDGGYELKVPYSRPEELVMDILKYGPEVEVIGPAALCRQVAQALEKAAERYRK